MSLLLLSLHIDSSTCKWQRTMTISDEYCVTFVNAVTGPSEDEAAVGRISGESEEKRGGRKRERTKYVHFGTFHPRHLCSSSLMTKLPPTVTYSKALAVQLRGVLCNRSDRVSDDASFCYRCFSWTMVFVHL